jgi:hypothetical protein
VDQCERCNRLEATAVSAPNRFSWPPKIGYNFSNSPMHLGGTMTPNEFDILGQVLGGAGLLLTCLAVLIPIAVLIAFFGMYSRLGRINNTLIRIEGQLMQQNAALERDTAVLPVETSLQQKLDQ